MGVMSPGMMTSHIPSASNNLLQQQQHIAMDMSSLFGYPALAHHQSPILRQQQIMAAAAGHPYSPPYTHQQLSGLDKAFASMNLGNQGHPASLMSPQQLSNSLLGTNSSAVHSNATTLAQQQAAAMLAAGYHPMQQGWGMMGMQMGIPGQMGIQSALLNSSGSNTVGNGSGQTNSTHVGFGSAGADSDANGVALVVSNLPAEATWNDLRDLCETFGPVARVEIFTDDDRSRGSGVAKFQSNSDAERAVRRLNGYTYGGRLLEARLEPSRFAA